MEFVGIEIVDLSDFTVRVSLNLHEVCRVVDQKLDKMEWSILCKSNIGPKGAFVTGVFLIPKQEVTASSVDFDPNEDLSAYREQGYNTVIHKHPGYGKSFSSDDMKYINANFPLSLLYCGKDYGEGTRTIDLAEGVRSIIKIPGSKIDVVYPAIDVVVDEADIAKIKKKVWASNTAYPNRYYDDDYYGGWNRAGKGGKGKNAVQTGLCQKVSPANSFAAAGYNQGDFDYPGCFTSTVHRGELEIDTRLLKEMQEVVNEGLTDEVRKALFNNASQYSLITQIKDSDKQVPKLVKLYDYIEKYLAITILLFGVKTLDDIIKAEISLSDLIDYAEAMINQDMVTVYSSPVTVVVGTDDAADAAEILYQTVNEFYQEAENPEEVPEEKLEKVDIKKAVENECY